MSYYASSHMRETERGLAYPADGSQDDLRFPDEREDVERSSRRLPGTVRAAAVHLSSSDAGSISHVLVVGVH